MGLKKIVENRTGERTGARTRAGLRIFLQPSVTLLGCSSDRDLKLILVLRLTRPLQENSKSAPIQLQPSLLVLGSPSLFYTPFSGAVEQLNIKEERQARK